MLVCVSWLTRLTSILPATRLISLDVDITGLALSECSAGCVLNGNTRLHTQACSRHTNKRIHTEHTPPCLSKTSCSRKTCRGGGPDRLELWRERQRQSHNAQKVVRASYGAKNNVLKTRVFNRNTENSIGPILFYALNSLVSFSYNWKVN